MKIIHRNIEKDRSGWIKLVAEDDEDIWNCYNLICTGDRVETLTFRRIQSETANGKSESERIKMVLCLEVERVDVDLTTETINFKGKNRTENKHVKLGSYHTSTIEIGQAFKIYKDEWDKIALDRIQKSCEIREKAEIAAVLVQEGLCNICLITDFSTCVVQTIHTNIPKKRRGIPSSNYERILERFYQSCLEAMTKWLNLDKLKVVIIAGPGFANEQLLNYVSSHSSEAMLKCRSKFVLASCSSAIKQSLDEVFRNPSIVPRIASTRFAQDIKIMESFIGFLSSDPSRAYYGYVHVNAALELGAIADLLVSDSLFRSDTLEERRKYIKLVEDVRNSGGSVHIFSSVHSTGEKLDNLCGVAAILRFSVPELEEIEVQQ